MTRLRKQSGSALVAALTIAGILLPVGAWMLMQTRADAMISRNLRNELEALYVAEAGMAHAVSQIEADGSLDQLLTAPTGGVSPFAVAPPPFPESPLHYEVIVMPLRSDTLRLTSTGFGRSGAIRRIEACLRRDETGRFQVRWREDG